MNYATALSLIQAEIIANGNNEITANVLRPVLEAMIDFPNDVIGVLADLDTSDTTSIVNAINSILNQNLPNKTVLFPIDTTGIDFNQDELLWVRDAINQTATNNGAFTCNLGEQMVFFCDVLIDIIGTEANMQRRYYRLTSGATLVNSLGSTLTPPLMPDGSSFNTIELTGDLVIDLGDIGTDDVEDAFNSDASQPFTINGDKFVQAIQNSENKLWQWIGGDGTFGNSATLATSTDFVDLTGTTSPPLATVLNDNQDVEIDTPTDGQILVFDNVDGKWKNETLPAGGTVQSVTGDSVDNTDPNNPVVNAIPLSGTEVGSPVIGDIEFAIGGYLFNGVPYRYAGGDDFNVIGFKDEAGIYKNYIGLNIDESGVEIYSENTSTGDFQNFNLVSWINSKGTNISISNYDYINVQGANINSRGIVGELYYGANYDDNTYVQKKYVDDLIATSLPTENQIKGKKLTASVSGTYNIDLNAASDFHLTMTADTAFTFTNTPTGNEVKRCKIRLTGEFAPSWTQGGLNSFGDAYDGTKWNDILVEMWLDGTIKGLLIFQQRETA